MTLVLVGKDLILRGWPSKIEDTQVPGWYISGSKNLPIGWSYATNLPTFLRWNLKNLPKPGDDLEMKRWTSWWSNWKSSPGVKIEKISELPPPRLWWATIVSKYGSEYGSVHGKIPNKRLIYHKDLREVLLYFTERSKRTRLARVMRMSLHTTLCPHKKKSQNGIWQCWSWHLVTSS